MQTFLLENYLWLKALHVISLIAWMAGMFYLPRLFAYHAENISETVQAKTFEIMEARLLRIIMNPAMIATWIFGALMLYANTGLMELGWMHVKLTGVVLMTGLHMVFAKWRKNLLNGKNIKTPKFYKLWNEAPTILMVIIVIMAVAEPF
ncbi:MAG: TIGR00701 family protein [Micavibrio sp.]|nr:TIGR00701 family protein [Micavibrio sp.]